MEDYIIHVLDVLRQVSIESQEWQQFKESLKNEEFLKSIFNIILNPQINCTSRQMAIIVLKVFNIKISIQIINFFLPLLFDESIQELIAELIIISSEPQFLCESIFPNLVSQIQNQEKNVLLLKGIVYCFYYFVKEYQVRNQSILDFLVTILQNVNIDIKSRMLALETIFREIIPINKDEYNCLDYIEINPQDISLIYQLFIQIPTDDNNFQLFEYLLTFIHSKFPQCFQIFNLKDPDNLKIFANKLLNIYTYILTKKMPIDPKDFNLAIILYELIKIINLTRIPIEFKSFFPLLILDDSELQASFTDLNDFYECFVTQNVEEIEGEDSIRKILYNFCTINDVRTEIMFHYQAQPVEYQQQVAQYCLTFANQKLSTNLAIIRFFNKLFPSIQIPLDPFQFNCYNNFVCCYFLLLFCISRVIGYEKSDSNPYYLFIKGNFEKFAADIANTNNPIYTYCVFDLLSKLPREFVFPNVFVITLRKTLDLVLNNLVLYNDKINLLSAVKEYLKNNNFLREFSINVALEKSREAKRFASDSIFKLPPEIINAFLLDAPNFFLVIRNNIINHKYSTKIVKKLSKIVFYFSAGNMVQLVDRNRDLANPLVNLSEFNAFHPIIFQCFSELLGNWFMKDSTMIENCLNIFIYAFTNIQFPGNPNYVMLINQMYSYFCHIFDNCPNELPTSFFVNTIRIFITNGKIDRIFDFISYLIKICSTKKENDDDNVIDRIYDFIRIFTYELSFILIHPDIYSIEKVKHLSDWLFKIIKILPDLLEFSLIYARVALFNVELFKGLLPIQPIQFLALLYQRIINNFSKYQEIEMRTIIALFALFCDNVDVGKMLQNLLLQLTKKLDDNFSKAIPDTDQTYVMSSFSFITVFRFYDDAQFLSHPLISSSVCNLIQQVVKNPLDQNYEMAFKSFMAKYPEL